MWPFLSSSWVAFGSGRFCQVCLGTGDSPRLLPLSVGWVYCLAPEAPQKGECQRGRRYFWPCRTRVGFAPATGPTLKTALCHIRALVRRNDKYQRRLLRRGLEFHVCIINKSAHTKKSLETYWVFLVYHHHQVMLTAQFPDFFLSLPPTIHHYHPLFLADLPSYILCLHSWCKSLLINQHWHVHMQESIRECRLWVHPCLISNI